MKKGELSQETLVILLLVALLAAGIIGFSYKAGQAAKDSVHSGNCLASIQAASKTKEVGALPVGQKGDPFLGINCPREDVTLQKKDIVEKGVINQDKAHAFIAEEMKSCWQKVGQGKYDPFSDWNDVEDKSICMICSQIHFDPALKEFMQNNLKSEADIAKYGITSPLPYLAEKTVPGSDKTYFEYLYGSPFSSELTSEEKEQLQRTLLDDDSLILISMYKGDERVKTNWKWLAAGVGAGLVVGLGMIAALPSGGSSLVLAIGGAKAILVAATFEVSTIMAGYAYNAYRDCPDCGGVGGIKLVPGNKDLYAQDFVEINGEPKALCDIIAN